MFDPKAVKEFTWDRTRYKIESNDIWGALKEFADLARSNERLTEYVIGKVPPTGSDVIAYNVNKGEADYIVGGVFQANMIAREIANFFDDTKSLDILDFGFGAARLLRYFTFFQPQNRYYGVEVNPACIGHVNEVAPEVDARLIQSDPPLPFGDETMDVVYSWSIWTHFNEPVGRAWLEEVHRVLRPGGIALHTVHTDDLVKRYGEDPMLVKRMERRKGDYSAILKEYTETGFSYWDAYPEDAKGYGIDIETFGMAFISQDYIKKHWTDLFEYRGLAQGTPGWQDIVVLVKP